MKTLNEMYDHIMGKILHNATVNVCKILYPKLSIKVIHNIRNYLWDNEDPIEFHIDYSVNNKARRLNGNVK